MPAYVVEIELPNGRIQRHLFKSPTTAVQVFRREGRTARALARRDRRQRTVWLRYDALSSDELEMPGGEWMDLVAREVNSEARRRVADRLKQVRSGCVPADWAWWLEDLRFLLAPGLRHERPSEDATAAYRDVAPPSADDREAR